MRSLRWVVIVSSVLVTTLVLNQNCGRQGPMEVMDPGLAPRLNVSGGPVVPYCATPEGKADVECYSPIITGVAYCVDYQNGSEARRVHVDEKWLADYRWTCGDGTSQFPTTWVYLGDATKDGCGGGSHKSLVHSIVSQAQYFNQQWNQFEVGFVCEKDAVEGTNQILGFFYCTQDRDSGECVSNTEIRVGAANENNGCDEGRRVYTRRGRPKSGVNEGAIVGYACVTGSFNNRATESFQPQRINHIAGAAYCGEGPVAAYTITADNVPIYGCSSEQLKVVGEAVWDGKNTSLTDSTNCLNGAKIDTSSILRTPGTQDPQIRGFRCQKEYFSHSSVGSIPGVAYCAEYHYNDKVSGCGGSTDPSTWNVFGLATKPTTYCTGNSVKSEEHTVKGRAGYDVGFICKRPDSNNY